MNAPGSCLAIDYGTKRCGLARSDPNRVLATGLPTFERRPGTSFHAHLRALLADGDYALVVLGFPHHDPPETRWDAPAPGSAPRPVAGRGSAPESAHASGPESASEPSAFGAEIRSLGGWIGRELGLRVVFWDESLTSHEAERRLRSARRAQRRDKGAIDRLAAEILLQEFLDAGCPEDDVVTPVEGIPAPGRALPPRSPAS